MLVSRRYERASLIVTSNKRFSAWGETFGDDMAAVAMVDRLIHDAELISLKGDSYRPKDRDLGQRPARPWDTARPERPPAFRSARLDWESAPGHGEGGLMRHLPEPQKCTEAPLRAFP